MMEGDEFAPDMELEDDGFFRGRMSFRDLLLEELDDKEPKPLPPPRKKKRGSSLTVQSLLEAVIARQQRFFNDLLESIERKEQIREQIRQEKEEKWRAEERAQLDVFNNAMLALTQVITDDRNVVAALPGRVSASIGGSPEGPTGPKRRSKNWKRAEVLQLIKLRGEMDGRFATCTKRAGLWEELAESLAGHGVKRDGKQCREKWDKLMAEQKDVADGKKDPGDSPYFADLTEIVGTGRLILAAKDEGQ